MSKLASWASNVAGRLAWRCTFRYWMAAILVSAAALWSAGLGRDLPFVYHCDTSKQVNVIYEQVVRGHLGWQETGYPVGHMQAASAVLAAAGAAGRWLGLGDAWSNQTLFVTARLVVLAGALLALAFTMLGGRLLWGAGAGLLAGLLLCLDELYLIHSHFAMGDLPMAGMFMGALYLSARVLSGDRLWDSLWAGLFAGLAAGVKYQGLLALVVVITAHVLARPRPRWRGLPLAILGAALGFVLLTPAIWVDCSRWWALFRQELAVQSGLSLLSQTDRLAWTWSGVSKSMAMWAERSLIVPYLFLPALAALCWRRSRADLLLLTAWLPAMIAIMVLRSVYLRDWDQLLLGPLMALGIARGAQIAWRRGPWHGWRRGLLAGGLAALIAAQGWYSVEAAAVMRLPDTRKLAEQWLSVGLPPAEPGQTLYINEPLPTSAHLNGTDDYLPKDRGWREDTINTTTLGRFRFVYEHLDKRRTQYLIIQNTHAEESIAYLDRELGPLKVFALKEMSWHDPVLRVYETGPKVLSAPVAPPETGLAGWEEAAWAGGVAGRRQPRELQVGVDPVERVIISDRPLDYLAVAIQGGGLVRVEHGGGVHQQWAMEAAPRIISMRPHRSYPYLVYVYRLRMWVEGGEATVRLLLCRAAEAEHLARMGAGPAMLDREPGPLELLDEAARRGEEFLPQDRLLWAGLLERAGRIAEAAEQRALADAGHAGLAGAFSRAGALAPGRMEEAAGLIAATLGGGVSPRALTWRGQVHNLADAPETPGIRVADAKTGERFLRLPAGRVGWSKLWLPGRFAGPRLVVRFHLRAAPGPAGAAARVDVYGHYLNQPRGVLAGAEVSPPPEGGTLVVEVPFTLPWRGAGLEVRVQTLGLRDLEAGEVDILPDLPVWARQTMCLPAGPGGG